MPLARIVPALYSCYYYFFFCRYFDRYQSFRKVMPRRLSLYSGQVKQHCCYHCKISQRTLSLPPSQDLLANIPQHSRSSSMMTPRMPSKSFCYLSTSVGMESPVVRARVIYEVLFYHLSLFLLQQYKIQKAPQCNITCWYLVVVLGASESPFSRKR